MTQPADSVVRAMTDDGAFRVIAARTTETTRGALASQGTAGANARLFAELLTSAVLLRETLAPTLRVQAILRGRGGRGRLVADAHPDGATRGLVTLPKDGGDVRFGGDATLEVQRVMPQGAPHNGLVGLESDLATGLMTYLKTSEQIVSMIAVSAVMDGDAVVSAGGYVLQVLPEAHEGLLMLMTERLRDFESIDKLLVAEGFGPDVLVDEIFYRMPFTRLHESAVRFECKCSQTRVVLSLATLPRADLEDLVRKGEVLEVNCDYCNREYRVPPAQLRGLLGKRS